MGYENITYRVDGSLQAQFEEVLRGLGVSAQEAYESLCRQTIARKALPFQNDAPKALEDMTKEELDTKLGRGYEQSVSGQGRPLDEVFDELERRFFA